MKIKFALLLLCLCGHAVANHHGATHKRKHKAEKDHQPVAHSQNIQLSPELQQLLRQEMQQIKAGMESLVLAGVSADWQTITKVGQQIKQSYVFKQQLSKKQRHELHQKLPLEFIKLDQKLHHYAGMLAHVAQERDIELVNYYIYKMNETCASCHSNFAKQRFGGFKAKNKHKSDHH